LSAYISLTELKNTAELVGTNFADYDLQAAINAASDAINEFCGRRFDSDPTGATVSRRYTARRAQSIDIDDLISATTVAVDWDGNGTFEQPWTATSQYDLWPFNAALDGKPYEQIRARPYSGVWFPGWPGAVQITGRWGWPAVPSQVVEATTIHAARLVKRARDTPFGVVGFGMENYAVRIPRIDPDVAFLLDNLIRGQGVLAA